MKKLIEWIEAHKFAAGCITALICVLVLAASSLFAIVPTNNPMVVWKINKVTGVVQVCSASDKWVSCW